MRRNMALANAGIFVLSAKNALAYSPLFGGVHEGVSASILTSQGQWLSVYALLWGVSAVASIAGFFTNKNCASLLLFIFLVTVWSGGYFAAWAVSGFDSPSVMSAVTYLSLTLAYTGFFRIEQRALSRENLRNTTALARLIPNHTPTSPDSKGSGDY